jgi:hypothetical protein
VSLELDDVDVEGVEEPDEDSDDFDAGFESDLESDFDSDLESDFESPPPLFFAGAAGPGALPRA